MLLSTIILMSCMITIINKNSSNNTLDTDPTPCISTPEPIRVVEKIVLQSAPPVLVEPASYYQQIKDVITDADRNTLASLVFLEAGNQSILGQRAVVEVVFNRVLSNEFPNTISDVIYQRNQFTPTKYISSTTPTQEQYDVIDEVLNELYPVLDDGVVFFSRGQYNDYLYDKIGDHYFCYSKLYYETQKGAK